MSATYRTTLQITMAEQLVIPKVQLLPKVKRFLRERLFILNSEYIIKERLGKPVYDVPKFFDLIEDSPPDVRLPRGFLGQLTDFLDTEKIPYQVTHHHPNFAPRGLHSTITLTPEQERLTRLAFDAGQGVIVAPPGSGKSMMGLELIARHDAPALILTHRKQLFDQWIEHIETYFGLSKKQIGRYSSAYKKSSEYVTVGLLQSFARAKDLSEFTEQFGTIVVDECHHIPAKTFRAVISRLNASHVYGLTATPKRKHNDERLIYLYIGDIVATQKPRVSTAKAATEFGITIRETALELPFDWRTDQFELLAKVICYDTARNEQIVQDILQQVRSGRRTLVLSERKEHLKMLELYLRGDASPIVFSGDDPASKRAVKLEKMKSGEYDVILATGQLVGEGMHIATIETLILAFPFAFEGKLAQYAGRLLHSEQPGQLIDYRDTRVAVLEKQYKKRQRYYNRIQMA